MRRVFAIGALIGAAALVAAQMGGAQLLGSFAKTLNEAKSLSSTFTVQTIGGTTDTYKIDLAKPNKARIDTPGQLIIADGSEITTYNKDSNTYSKSAQTDADFHGLFHNDSLSLYGGFFDSNYFAHANVSKEVGSQNRKGKTFSTVTVASGKKTSVYYFDPSDKMVKLGQFEVKDPASPGTVIVTQKDLSLDTKQDASQFVFTAPEGAKPLAIWFSSLDAAEAEAKSSGRKIFVDFMASWCGPCKMLDRDVFESDDFQKLAKSFVFLKIDVDEQQSVAEMYKIEAMPTQLVLDSSGKELARTVGYGGASRFFNWISAFVN